MLFCVYVARKYCRMTHNSLSPVDQLIKNLELARQNKSFYDEYCTLFCFLFLFHSTRDSYPGVFDHYDKIGCSRLAIHLLWRPTLRILARALR